MKNRNLDHKNDWKTPDDFYKMLDDEFHFDFDPCPFMHDMSWDGLVVEWGKMNFVNPPYERKAKESFIRKTVEELFIQEKGSVLLLPVSTSTKIFSWLLEVGVVKELRFVDKRIPFQGWNNKGQMVNWPNPTNDTIQIREEREKDYYISARIPLHVKNTGQHDSMLLVIDHCKETKVSIQKYKS
jgi:hypothetical protein